MKPRLAVAILTILFASCATSANAAVLVDQYTNGTDGIASQDVDNDGAYDAGPEFQAADDFTVPAGEQWSITGVDVNGQYYPDGASTAGPASSVDVYIYPGSSPSGSTPIARKGQAFTDISGGLGSLRVTLDSPVSVGGGTYWVSVWVHQNASTNGRWYWSRRTFQTGAAAVLFGQNAFCTLGWHTFASCFIGSGPDLVWRLNGVKKDGLTYTNHGGGQNGTVTSSPAGINCPENNCQFGSSALFDDGTQVTLTATNGTNGLFTGWTGCDQPSGNTCVMNMNNPATAKSVDATFAPAAHLTFRKTGDADGRVVPSSGSPCEVGQCKGNSISWKFVKGSQATITAFSAADSVFAGWTGCDHPSRNVCVMDMTGPKSLSAKYTPAARLTVNKDGDGDGTVVGDLPPVDCQIGECLGGVIFKVASNTPATVRATPSLDSPPSTFAGWTGCDHPSGRTCVMDMGAPGAERTVHAIFNKGKVLTVSKTGSGSGTVTSGVPGIDCGGVCKTVFEPNSAVTLTAQPDPGSTFTGWTGACSGTGDCVALLDSDRVVAASFTATGDPPPPPAPPPPPPPPPITTPNGGTDGAQTQAPDPGRVLIGEDKALHARKDAVEVPFQCTAATQCTVQMQFLPQKKKSAHAAAAAKPLGSGSLKLKPGKKGKVKVKLTRAAVKDLKKKKLKITIKTVVKAGASKVTIETNTTLKR